MRSRLSGRQFVARNRPTSARAKGSLTPYGVLVMAWVEHGGVRLYYERRGSGPPLLFISGTGADLRVPPSGFDYAFSDRRDTICFDQRGLGRSDQPRGPYSMADYADDAANLLDAVGFSSALVVGVSFGGMVAQELVLGYPEHVARLVLCCSSSGGAGGSSYPLHLLPERHLGFAERLAITDVRWSDPNFVDPLRDEALARLLAPVPPSEGAKLQLQARSLHDTYDRLDQIRCPVLVAGGRYDGQAPPENARVLAERIPGARLEFFEGGHPFLRQDPQAVSVIEAFLSEEPLPLSDRG
jgi:3-oxoadipate enol-lactonase